MNKLGREIIRKISNYYLRLDDLLIVANYFYSNSIILIVLLICLDWNTDYSDSYTYNIPILILIIILTILQKIAIQLFAIGLDVLTHYMIMSLQVRSLKNLLESSFNIPYQITSNCFREHILSSSFIVRKNNCATEKFIVVDSSIKNYSPFHPCFKKTPYSVCSMITSFTLMQRVKLC